MRILIVDDSKVILKMANDIILSNKICDNVETVNSGEECIEILKNEDFDIILLDIIMPKMNGLQVLRKIKEMGKLSYTKVLMFTSISDKESFKESFELGASDYISKPIEPIVFITRIKNALNEQELGNKLRNQIKRTMKKNDELFELYEKLKATQTQLIHREKLIGIGQLASGIAHEINNPLGYIMSNIETLNYYVTNYKNSLSIYENILKNYDNSDFDKKNALEKINDMNLKDINSDTEDLFDDINEGLHKVKEIVKGIRFFSNVDSNSEIELYNINEGIKNVLLIGESKYKDFINIEVDLGQIPNIWAYSAEINQSILNILINSIQSIKEKELFSNESIFISTKVLDNNIFIKIKDTGNGIDKSIINNIFNPFFTTKPVGSGSGLGLAIVYDVIVNKQGGDIKVYSEVGEGTEIIIKLPKEFLLK